MVKLAYAHHHLRVRRDNSDHGVNAASGGGTPRAGPERWVTEGLFPHLLSYDAGLLVNGVPLVWLPPGAVPDEPTLQRRYVPEVFAEPVHEPPGIVQVRARHPQWRAAGLSLSFSGRLHVVLDPFDQ